MRRVDAERDLDLAVARAKLCVAGIGGGYTQKMIGESKICAVVAAENAAAMWRQLERALAETKTVELRLDWLANDREIERFLARLAASGARRGVRPGSTIIATCRRREAVKIGFGFQRRRRTLVKGQYDVAALHVIAGIHHLGD